MHGGQLDVEHREDVAIVTLTGEHDLATAERLSQRLGEIAAAATGVVVDVGEVEFIDLATIRALLKTDEALHERGRRLTLQLGTACLVARLLQLTEVESLLVCAHDRDTAITLAKAQHPPAVDGTA